MKFLPVALLCLFTGSILAQSSTTGGIQGKVSDPAGAVVPNATVTVTEISTNKTQTINADEEGIFRVTNLTPGTYRVGVTSGSFAAFKNDSVIVEVGRSTPLDVTLRVSGANAQVEVTSEAPVVNTNDMANATNIDQTQISELPINGRRASDFVRLTPGVNPDGDFGLNSFRGLSSLLNNSTLDGTDNNNTFFSEERGRTRIQYAVSQAAVREFQVNSTNYSAEYGRAAGAVVNTVTKSGTNDIRGELFFFDRNNKWGARNPSAVLPGNVAIKPKDVRYQFGGAIGGKIVTDKLFYFFSYDQQKRNFPGVATTTSTTILNPITVAAPTTPCPVPTPASFAAAFTPGNQLFCMGITQAQADAQLAFLRGLTGEVPRRQDQKIFFPRIDWIVNKNNTAAFTYNRVRTDGISAFQTPSVVFVGAYGFGNDFVSIDTFNARLTTTISPTMINEFRFQHGSERARAILGTLSAGEQALASRATTSFGGLLSSVSYTNGLQFGTSANFQRNKFPYETTEQFVDSLTWTRGNHSLKFGTDIKFTTDDIDNLRTGAGQYNYNNVQDLIGDIVNPNLKRYSAFAQGFGLAAYTIKTPDYAFFLQDDWRIHRRLTINLGVRYDLQSFGKPQFPNYQSAALTAGQTRYTVAQANNIIAQTTKFPRDKDNVGPRVGFAWDMFGDGKTSLRGGYGIYYGRIPNTFLTSPLVNSGAPGSQLSITNIRPTDTLRDINNNIIPTPIFPNTLTGVPFRSLSIVVMSPNLQNPKIYEGDVIFERQIASNTAASISYVWNRGHNLSSFIDRNLNAPSTTRTYTVVGGPYAGSYTTPFFTGARPLSNFGTIIEVESQGTSKYDGLILQIQRRMTKGLQFQASYTFAKAYDTGQQAATFAPTFPTVSNEFDRQLDYGRSDFDIRHHFVGSAVWEIGRVFGWDKSGFGKAFWGGLQLSPIVNISSGRPVTPFISASPTGGTSSGLLGSGNPQRIFFIPRGADSRPMVWTTDLRLSKKIRFGEHRSLELLAEGFNIFNRANVTQVIDQQYSFVAATNTLNFQSNYLTPSTINNTFNLAPRQIQLGARFHF